MSWWILASQSVTGLVSATAFLDLDMDDLDRAFDWQLAQAELVRAARLLEEAGMAVDVALVRILTRHVRRS